ncbi:MAG: 50S ribosomal protein L6 [Gammaproteobacteria bacterium]|nr:50S ribosomal protein L6 [Gammaproteobacteria bacterium]
MSRVAKNPVVIPAGVEVSIAGRTVDVKGPKGAMQFNVHRRVTVAQQKDGVLFDSKPQVDSGMMMAGTMRALFNNMVQGVSQGFERKLELVGVGYRASVRGNTLNLTLGYSHPIEYPMPEGVSVETPTQTEVIVRGIDKQLVGHVAAQIRNFRRPEPYKGKGVKYAGERIVRKEAKKK